MFVLGSFINTSICTPKNSAQLVVYPLLLASLNLGNNNSKQRKDLPGMFTYGNAISDCLEKISIPDPL